MAGAPWYKSGSYTYRGFGRVPVNSTSYFDLSYVSSIPESAVVTGVKIGGSESGSATGRVRSICPSSSYSWIDCREYAFSANNVYNSYNPIFVKQDWMFKHTARRITSGSYYLTPWVQINYMAEDPM